MEQKNLLMRFTEVAPPNVNEAFERGDLWRAKEILQSRISGGSYDSSIFECYGILLLFMQDELEAGKYLFLSGHRFEEYDASINLYLNRHTRAHVNILFSTFPASVRNQRLETYPNQVKRLLLSKGYVEPKQPARRDPQGKTRNDSTEGFIYLSLGCLFMIGLMICFVVGFTICVQIGFEFILEWLSN